MYLGISSLLEMLLFVLIIVMKKISFTSSSDFVLEVGMLATLAAAEFKIVILLKSQY